jgi:cbb3-type cytochrome oxidase subunit 3
MKFTTYLETIHGITVYPIFSLVLFVIFFAAVTYLAFKEDKKTIEYLENLPLNN